MATRTTYQTGRPAYIEDQSSVIRTGGRQIDWANVNVSFKNAQGYKVIPAGTPMGELLGSGHMSPRVVTTNPATGLLETNAIEGDESAASTGYSLIKGGVVYDNLLPGATGTPAVIASAIKTELATAGCYFTFVQYEDDTA